jgi:hypothetical protein
VGPVVGCEGIDSRWGGALVAGKGDRCLQGDSESVGGRYGATGGKDVGLHHRSMDTEVY